MKSQTFKLFSALLSAVMLTMVPVLPTSYAAEIPEITEKPFTVTEDENGIHFIGATGALSGDNGNKDETATVIASLADYYEVTNIQNTSTNVNLFSSLILKTSSSLPESVDNSTSEYFPEIDTQGSLGSCVAWGQTYYQFTYEMNKSMGVKTTPENTFSPKWTFNFANNGKEDGSWDFDVYTIMKEIGNVPLSIVPYDYEYLSWTPIEDVWKTAMKYRISGYQYFMDPGTDSTQITSPDDTDLAAIKTAINNGEMLAFTSVINSLNYDKLKTNPSAPENDKYANEYVVISRTSGGAGHRMVIVGYNDNIWTDINGNDIVDSGEMGALKIANSWGEDYCNDGFAWVSYDALNKTSCVPNAPSNTNRSVAMDDVTRIDILPYNSDASIYLRYTLNTSDRYQGKMYITAEKDGKEYTYEAGPKRLLGMYNSNYSYDGTTQSNDGTMVYALSNVVPELTSENLHEYNWSIKFEDIDADGKAFTVKNVEIVDESTGRVCKPENVFPFTLDGSSKTVDYPEIPVFEPKTYYRGDANGDEVINIKDVTLIQKYIAKIVSDDEILTFTSDTNKDNAISIKDATTIQMYIANYNKESFVGEIIYYTPTPTEPTTTEQPTQPTQPDTEPTTEPTTQPTTVAVKNKVTFTNSLSWSGTISCYYWSNSNKAMTTWPGKAMTYSETNNYGEKIYTFEVPDGATYVIFTNGSSQTTDIPYSGGEVRYYPLSTTDSNGHNNVATW